MSLRVGMDARFAMKERRGIGNYSVQIIKSLSMMRPDIEFVLYSDRVDAEGIFKHLPNCTIKVITPGFYPYWEQVALPGALRDAPPDLFHSLGNTAPLRLPVATRLVVTLHDVMFMKPTSLLPNSPSAYQRLGRHYRRWNVPRSAGKAAAILTVSDYSRQDILATLPGLRPERVHVTYQGLPAHFEQPEAGRGADPLGGQPFLLHLGGVDPRKNTAFVIRNFLELRRSGGMAETLVLLGLSGLGDIPLSSAEREEAAACVRLPGFVPEASMPSYFRWARALLFPSRFEGFGIPLLEAMACGTPAIASRVTSLPEIAGDAALLVDPGDGPGFRAAVLQVLQSHDIRASLAAKGLARSREFTWNRTADRTLKAYAQAVDHG